MIRVETVGILAALLLVAPPRSSGSDTAATERALELTREAAKLVEQKQYEQALGLLREAQQIAPRYAPAQEWLAHTYELVGDKTQALNHVAALLSLQPRSQFGAEAAKRLFYTAPFPRRLNRAILSISPVAFTVDEGCVFDRQRVSGWPAQQALCYTSSLKYPDEAPNEGPIVERALPGTPNTRGQFNRGVYGYLEEHEAGEFRLAVIVYYPSQLLSGKDTDLAPTAQRLAHLALRYRMYAQGYLGLPPQGDREGINRIWLCLDGPDGAERQETDIFLYRVLSAERSPLEWLRQLAHECGHLLIPAIGGFASPEMWGNGEVGERLFLHWLAKEAGIWSKSGWPSSEASKRLDALWPGAGAAIEDYLAAAGRAPLGVWAAEGPESELIMGMDDRAMQYYVGFVLYILAAHGEQGLREVMQACTGTTVADFVYSYKQTIAAWAKKGPVTVAVGCFSPTDTRLSHPPPPANLSPPSLTLEAGDSVAYVVYLTAGNWSVELGVQDAGSAFISFDGSQETTLNLTPEQSYVPIGPLSEGWHRLRLRLAPGQGSVRLHGLTFALGQPPES